MKFVQIITNILMPIIIVICEKYANGYSVNINACSESVSKQQISGNDDYILQLDLKSVGARVVLCHCYIWTEDQALNNVEVDLQLNLKFYRRWHTCGNENYPCDFFKSTACNMTACTDDIITDTKGSTTHEHTFGEVVLYEILLRYLLDEDEDEDEDLNEESNVGSLSLTSQMPMHLHIQCGPLDEIGNKPPRPDFNTHETQSTSSPNTDGRLHCEKSSKTSTACVPVIVVLIIMLLCLLLVGGFCYLYFYRRKQTPMKSAPTTQTDGYHYSAEDDIVTTQNTPASNENRTSHPDTGAMYSEPRLTSAKHKRNKGNATSHVYANNEQLAISDDRIDLYEVEDGYDVQMGVDKTIVPVVEEYSPTTQFEKNEAYY